MLFHQASDQTHVKQTTRLYCQLSFHHYKIKQGTLFCRLHPMDLFHYWCFPKVVNVQVGPRYTSSWKYTFQITPSKADIFSKEFTSVVWRSSCNFGRSPVPSWKMAILILFHGSSKITNISNSFEWHFTK